MRGLLIILLILGCLSCAIFGYLGYKFWIHRKRIMGKDMMRNRNASTRRKRSKKKKKRKSRKSKRRPTSRSKKKKKKRKRSSSKKRTRAVTINPVPQIVEPMNTRIERINPNQGFPFIARRRSKPPSPCLNDNDESYSTLFELANYVDSMKNVLPCNDNDMTNLSKYDYELNYDEEHLFRC